MKGFISLIGFVLLAMLGMAQDKTISVSLDANVSTYKQYTGLTADTITINQDTIDVWFKYQSQGFVKKLAVKTKLDLVSGLDTVSVSVFGKEFYEDATPIEIIAASTVNVAASNQINVFTSDYTETIASYVASVNQANIADADTITFAAQTITPFDKTYRFYRVRFIHSGLGNGTKIDDIELKLYIE
jgi:hypothetical protein